MPRFSLVAVTFVTAILTLFPFSLNSQPVVNRTGDVVIGGPVPDPSAILELMSDSKGFLMTRMTTAQRDAIPSPAPGLMVFNTDLGAIQVWSDASGGWSWDAVATTGSGLLWLIGGNTGVSPGTDYLGTTDATAMRILVDGPTGHGLIVNPDSSLQRDLGGDARGIEAVDLQVARASSSEVASGLASAVLGGRNNTASGHISVVGAGQGNVASGAWGVVAGGLSNRASGHFSIVGGGRSNDASGGSSVISGGSANVASGNVKTVGGGGLNEASGGAATVGGAAQRCL